MNANAPGLMSTTETCASCGAETPVAPGGVTHRYLASSAGCWARYGEVLAREYANPALMHIHALSVDAYAVQHPGEAGPQTIQSLNAHLASLFAHFRHNVPLERLADVRRRVIVLGDGLGWMAPPPFEHTVTVNDVWSTRSEEAHVAAVRRWAGAALAHWRDHHEHIDALLARI